MDFAELERRIDRLVAIDLRPRWEAYRAQGGVDVDGFLAFLGRSRAVDPSVLKELAGAAEVETPRLGDAAYRGTMLSEWARTVGASDAPGSAGAPGGHAAPPSSEARFQPISRLGEGAMGAVDLARDVYLRRKVALKTMLPRMARHPEVFDRFLSEMQITAQLEHPNIVPVYALDVRADGSLGYAMKLVQGRDLETLIDEVRHKVEAGEPLSEEERLDKRLEYFLKVCDALEYAHSKGIVHRDLKPANIMIGRHNEVYLMDWGIARPVGPGGQAVDGGVELAVAGTTGGQWRGRTQVGAAIGTPSYMSPEQAAGKNPELDQRSDVYAMGLVLQECVTLKTAVEGATVEEVLTKAMLARRSPVPVGSQPGAVPREIDAIVRRATRLDPKDRYPTIRALADDVRRYLRGEPVTALPEGALRRAGRWLARHRMATLTLLLSVALVGATGTIGALVAGQARIDAAHARELRVSQMAAESAIQTQLVDRDLARYEAALEQLVGAAQIVIDEQPPGDREPYFEESFASRQGAPPDLGPSRRYGRDVSVIAPVTSLAPGVQREGLEPFLRSLGLLAPALRELLLGTGTGDFRSLSPADQRALVADTGVPGLRASLLLREGVTISFPGMAGTAPGDPRESPYYRIAEGKRGVVWGAPVVVGGESILPATAALHDDHGAYRGAALLEISLSRILDRGPARDLDYVQSRSLVGRDGKLMATDGTQVPLPPEVAAAIAAGKSGTIVAKVDGRDYQFAYYPLASLDWYYVAAGEVDRMMASKEHAVTTDPRKPVAAPARREATARPKAAPRPAPTADERVDAGAQVDAGSEVDAGSPSRHVKLGPLPKPTAAALSGSAAPPPAPSEEPPMPPNPFDKWKAYERQKHP